MSKKRKYINSQDHVIVGTEVGADGRYKWAAPTIHLPESDCDIVLQFPSGKKVTIQARPSNADVNYNGSLDIILPRTEAVTCWRGNNMEHAKPVNNDPTQAHIRLAKQLVVELP